MDKELERRGHCFVRYADDANIYVRSRRAGERVMALLRGLYGKLKLTINEAKSAVASVFGRKFLGYSLWVARGGEVKRKVANKPLATFKQRVRQLTRRSGGRSMSQVVHGLRPYLLGWKAYFGLAQTPGVWRLARAGRRVAPPAAGHPAQTVATRHHHLPGAASAGGQVWGCKNGGGQQPPLVAQQQGWCSTAY